MQIDSVENMERHLNLESIRGQKLVNQLFLEKARECNNEQLSLVVAEEFEGIRENKRVSPNFKDEKNDNRKYSRRGILQHIDY